MLSKKTVQTLRLIKANGGSFTAIRAGRKKKTTFNLADLIAQIIWNHWPKQNIYHETLPPSQNTSLEIEISSCHNRISSFNANFNSVSTRILYESFQTHLKQPSTWSVRKSGTPVRLWGSLNPCPCNLKVNWEFRATQHFPITAAKWQAMTRISIEFSLQHCCTLAKWGNYILSASFICRRQQQHGTESWVSP